MRTAILLSAMIIAEAIRPDQVHSDTVNKVIAIVIIVCAIMDIVEFFGGK